MLATLIGTFITSASIVIGADSAFTGGPPGIGIVKICQTGSRTVATHEGEAHRVHANGILQQYNVFRQSCEGLARASTSVEDQGQKLSESLREDLGRFLGSVRSSEVRKVFAYYPHGSYTAVAGFDPSSSMGTLGTPRVMIVEIVVRQTTSGALVADSRVSKLSLDTCGARFHGNAELANGLVANDPRLPEGERRRPAVVAARRAEYQHDCSSFGVEDAKTLFVTATRLTIEHGDAFGVSRGAVGGCITLATIPLTGNVWEEDIPADRYVSPWFRFLPPCDRRTKGPLGLRKLP
jgi:hypothetical protein